MCTLYYTAELSNITVRNSSGQICLTAKDGSFGGSLHCGITITINGNANNATVENPSLLQQGANDYYVIDYTSSNPKEVASDSSIQFGFSTNYNGSEPVYEFFIQSQW